MGSNLYIILEIKIKLWNDIPIEIKNLPGTFSFNSKLECISKAYKMRNSVSVSIMHQISAQSSDKKALWCLSSWCIITVFGFLLSFRCNCGIKNGKSMEAKNNTMISMKPKVLNTIRPSLLYLNTGRISASRTFFSTPFDAVFKGKKKEFSERKVLG